MSEISSKVSSENRSWDESDEDDADKEGAGGGGEEEEARDCCPGLLIKRLLVELERAWPSDEKLGKVDLVAVVEGVMEIGGGVGSAIATTKLNQLTLSLLNQLFTLVTPGLHKPNTQVLFQKNMTFRGGGSGGNNSVGGGASGVPRHYGSGSGMSRGGANFSHHYGRGGGPRNIVYDGKRMRKALTRRTLDYTSSMIRMLEAPQSPVTGKRYPGPLFPTPDYLLNLMPTFAYPDRPADAICTKFLHSSQNKIRVPTNICRWSPDGRRLITGASSGEITLWNGFSFNFETILQVSSKWCTIKAPFPLLFVFFFFTK